LIEFIRDYLHVSSFISLFETLLHILCESKAFNFDSPGEKTILAYSNEKTKNMRIACGGSIGGSIFEFIVCHSYWRRRDVRSLALKPASDIGNDENRISVTDNNYWSYPFRICKFTLGIYGARNIFNSSISETDWRRV